jgi:hypothetical protein
MEEKRSSAAWLIVALILLLLTPALYVLSVGPFVMLYPTADEVPLWVHTVYAPLIWLEQRSSVAGAFFAWYAELWRPRTSES